MKCIAFDSSELVYEQPAPIVNPLTPVAEGLESRRQVVFKALLGVGVATNDFSAFCEEYEETLSKAFKIRRLSRKKHIYKASHLTKQSPEYAWEIITEVIGDLTPVIDRIDLCCAHFEGLPFISIYGHARGERLHPVAFLNKIENVFPMICGWKLFGRARGSETILQFDHFEGKTSPAWKSLVAGGPALEVFYSGCEVNPLISVADMILRLVQKFPHGLIGWESLTKPIREYATSLLDKTQLTEITTSDELRSIAPDLPFDIDLTRYIKHPVCYIVWNPKEPREVLRSSFEWSEPYNLAMRKATTLGGCTKNLELGRDEVAWHLDEDFLIPAFETDLKLIEQLKEMHGDIPRVLTRKELRNEFSIKGKD